MNDSPAVLISTPPSADEPQFAPILESRAPRDDSDLADLIERDGRWHLDRGLPCGLDRYRRAVPDLAARPISLDAAIDVSLRSLALRDGAPSPTPYHTECLLKSYPELAGPIRIAALLNNQIAPTVGPSSRARLRSFPLPRQVGPEIGPGRRRYELVRALGRGSSGMVCEAIDHLLSDSTHAAKVAVKLIPVDEHTIQRQASEATKARRIDHPGVVRVLDRGLSEDGEVFLVYELIAGGDLQQWFESRDRRIPLRTAATLVADIAAGVEAAHAAGLVHCDLKPANVLIDPNGLPRVSDFGVSVAASAADSPASGPVPIGNLAFAAPEQVRGTSAQAAPPVDVYALGGMLYYLATGCLPHGSNASEVSATHDPDRPRRIPLSIRARRPDADMRLDRICARALQHDADARFQTAGALAADLNAWLQSRPIPSLDEPFTLRAGLWARRNPRVAALIGLSTLLLLAGGSAAGILAYQARASAQQVQDHERVINHAKDEVHRFYQALQDRNKQNLPMPRGDAEKRLNDLKLNVPGAGSSKPPGDQAPQTPRP